MKLLPSEPYESERLITERDAAVFLGYSERTLQAWRLRGGGPLYVKVSARSIRYRKRDLQAWIESRLTANTSAGFAGISRHG